MIASLAEIEALEAAPRPAHLAARSTLELLAAAAWRGPDRLAIRSLATGAPDEAPRDVTYAALHADVIRAANLFASLGVDATSAVSLLLPLAPETFVAMLGAQAAGVVNPINFLLEPAHIAALLREARCTVLLAPDPALVPGVWAKAQAIRDEVPTLRALLRVGGAPGPDSFETALAAQPSELAFARTIAPTDVASLFHTGGTTSAPKLARHTHGGLVRQTWANAQIWRPGPDEVYFNGLPPFHVGGANCLGLSPLTQGATVVLLTATGYRNPQIVAHFWAHVARLRPTVLAMVPTSWGAVMNQPSDGCDLSSVRLCHGGGAAMPLELAHAVERRLGLPIVEGWGMTELHGFGTMNPAAGECRIGSVGLRAPFTEVIVATIADGRVAALAPPGVIGHVLARGDQLFGGYVSAAHDAWIEPRAGDSPPAWSSGGRWLDTGDLGRLDADGYLWLTGRAKDVIIRGGHNIDPITIEEVLYQHPAVEAAAAVGRPDAHAGELPIAFVQLRPGATATPEELRAWARARISERAAAPDAVILLDRLPLTGVGKIFKPELRMRAAQLAVAAIVQELAGEGHAVTVALHPEKGTLVTVELARREHEEAIRTALGRLPIATAVTRR